jgi:hypothetical protein
MMLPTFRTSFPLILLVLVSIQQCSTVMAFSKPPPLALTLSFLRGAPVAFRKSTAATDMINNASSDEMTAAPSNNQAQFKAVVVSSEQQQQQQPQPLPLRQQDQSLEDFNAMCQQVISDNRREGAQLFYNLPVRERTFANVQL